VRIAETERAGHHVVRGAIDIVDHCRDSPGSHIGIVRERP
jgi:hypothetical protein